MTRKIVGIGIVLCLVFLTSVGVNSVTAIDLPPLNELNGADTITALSGQKSGENLKMDSGINKIVSDYRKSQSGTMKALSSSSQAPEKKKCITVETLKIFDDGRVKVYLDLEDKKDVNKLQEEYGLSGVITTNFSETVQVNVPVENLEGLANEDSVKFIRVPVVAMRNSNKIDVKTVTSPVISEGVKIIQADELHKVNITGKRIEAAIIDLGFANCENLEMGNITEKISFRQGVDIGGDGELHGTVCAEVFYDTALDVNLSFYTAGTSLEFVKAFEYIIEERKDISLISCSLDFLAVGPKGNDITCKAVKKAQKQGIVTVVSAGNCREYHWKGKANDKDGDGWVEFSDIAGNKDETIDMDIIPGDETMKPWLTWDEWPTTEQDFAIVMLVDTPSGLSVVHIEDSNNIGNEPIEACFITPYEDLRRTHLAIFINKGNSNTELELFTPDINMLQHNIYEESTTSLAYTDGVVSVGAIDWKSKQIELYSSQSEKLNFVGPTCVSTWGYGRQGFAGTSAATPHIAGAFALLMSAFPEATNEQILQALQEAALDLGPEGKDSMFGYGLPQVFDAYNYLCPPEMPENTTINKTVVINETNQP